MDRLKEEFIDYIADEKNYSEHTVEAYTKDLDQFLLFLNNSQTVNINQVDYSIIGDI